MEETSENMIHFKVRTFVALIVALVGGTNIVNTVVHNISDNEEQIEYNAGADERRRNNLKKEFDYKLTIIEKDRHIENLEKELEECHK